MLFFSIFKTPKFGTNYVPFFYSSYFSHKKISNTKKKTFKTEIECSLSITPALKKYFRLNTDENIQNTITAFQKISDEKNFFDFCISNREHLSYCLLYRLTALKLKTEVDSNVKNQSKSIENFRRKILENNLFIDQTISQSLILSEKRIKEVLDTSLGDRDILEKIGEGSLSVSCFWIVLNSALVAWEKKGNNERINNKTPVYENLKKIQKVFLNSERHQNMLANEILFLQDKLNSESILNFSINQEKELIEGIRILILQLEKLPSNSYGPLLKKIVKVCDQTLEKNFGSKLENLNNFKLSVPLTNIDTGSRLIEIQKNNM